VRFVVVAYIIFIAYIIIFF